jgi:hypothetical protein
MKGPWKALAFQAAASGAALVLSTSALAVGAGSSPAPARWKTTLGPVTWSGQPTALYPGAAGDTELVAVRVANSGHVAARLRSVTASIPTEADGDAETVAGADIRGCRASWFTISIKHGNRALPAEIASGASYTGRLDLAMRDSATNQDACEGASPAFTVRAG